ncbi:MAG: hypothetical protein JNK05_17945 [Myxococcales bacterium]|nr:hypothetical protein [Myxococcales bacterium]
MYRSPHPSTRGSVVRAWVERVFPAAADFVDEAPVATESERSWLADPKEPEQALPVKRRHVNFAWLGWSIGVWIYTAVATLTVLGRAWYEPWSSVVQFGWVPIALGFALALVRERRARAELACIRAARRQNVLGDTNVAAHDLRVISESKFPFPASKALIDLASHEALRGEFAEASVLLERGLAQGVSLPAAGRGTLHFVEGLLLRAMLFAWQGREAQAESAIATALAYAPIEPFASSTKYEVRFWTALALARRDQAIEIARGCDVHTITSGRTDLARDALLSLGDPSARARVLERIDAWPSVKTFFTKVCPWLLDALRETSSTGVRVDAAGDSEIPQEESGESRSAGEGDARGSAGR